ncbi:ornithine cyclodeaminase/mu-crystallin family protein [Pseudooceanicola batsensis HTCC2597]|uniref:Ornithine cyclodeaminase/mu-crystallin family protein n=1 Tax=Pseudooceanicola batsensis (strain ATCC BAA-863 / DSM 15984 / KCTC 12145 / HTCC2597) TaxID=252305 RepID=A3TUE9_PSEBH|nr:ornithine cyclodeaminase family protein [Pseudooceanicola batsensis]EAQ04145.1 ornithine cyclodeaminase/mu-crystallin family protein [Pseudooceanicola batsensis HTCC2597]
MKVITAKQVLGRITVAELVPVMEAAMRDVSSGHALHPPRFAIPINDAGRMGLMYGALRNPPLHGAKVLSLYPDAPKHGLSSHQGFVLLFESDTGRPVAAIEADALTALRTAAVSMLATRALARPDPETFCICGAGEQADLHLQGLLQCFAPREVRIWARRPDAARALAARFPDAPVRVVEALDRAVAGADVVITATSARQAFLRGADLGPGQHVNLVGASLADSREIDDTGVARMVMFTDSLESSGRESGEILGAKQAGAIAEDYPVSELGAVLSGDATGRTAADQITAYKSHGLIVQDLAAGWHIAQTLG